MWDYFIYCKKASQKAIYTIIIFFFICTQHKNNYSDLKLIWISPFLMQNVQYF